MKPVPLVLLLAVLLTSHVRPGLCRPRSFPGLFDGTGGRFKSQLDEVLLRAAGENAVTYLLGEKVLRFLQRNPRVRSLNHLPLFPYDDIDVARMTQLDAKALAHLARSLALDTEEGVAGEEEDRQLLLAKRNDDPPISIDLTFHLLRNMIEMAKIESQKEQAELNRKFLEEVGK